MAEIDFNAPGFGEADDARYQARAAQVGQLVNFVGAAMSLALIAGLAVWGYKLLVRDVSGIPVVLAIEGPMRVQPDDPGGERPAHQGLAVNRIAAQGEAAPPPDAITLAPRSADLVAEDVAQGALRARPAIAAAPVPRRVDPIEAAILAATTQVLTAEADLSGDMMADILPASVPGMARSPRPRPRPEGAALLLVSAAAPAAAATETEGEVDPATLASGTRLVQFGAYDTPQDARAAWFELDDRFAALLDGKGRVIEEAATGGRNFYRLRAMGFADLADARRFCAAFVAEGNDCIPVTTR